MNDFESNNPKNEGFNGENRQELLKRKEKFINLAYEFIKDKIEGAKFKEEQFVNDNNYEFTSEAVEKDKRKILEKQALMYKGDIQKYGTESADLMKKVSLIFEYLIFYQVRNNSWLNGASEEFTAYLASDFDDILNGVDIILEKKDQDGEVSNADNNPKNIYGVSIDVTYGSTAQVIAKKIDNIEAKMFKSNSGEKRPFLPPRIKYFKSDFTGQQGPIENIANLVVGANHEHILELFAKVFKNDIKLLDNKDKDEYKQNEPHPLNLMMLEQIWAQSSYLKCIAKFNGHADLYKKYVRMANIARSSFINMLNNVSSPDKLKQYFSEDASHQIILDTIDNKLSELMDNNNPNDNRSFYGVSQKPETRLLV